MKFSLIALSALALCQVEAIRLTAEPGVEAKPTVEPKAEEKKEVPEDAKPDEKNKAKVEKVAADAAKDGSGSAKEVAAIVAESYHPYGLPENGHGQPAISDQVGGTIASKAGTTIDTSNPKSSFFAPGNDTTTSSVIKKEDSPEYPGLKFVDSRSAAAAGGVQGFGWTNNTWEFDAAKPGGGKGTPSPKVDAPPSKEEKDAAKPDAPADGAPTTEEKSTL